MDILEIININDVPLIKALVINYMTYEYEADAELNDDSVLNELRYLYNNNLMGVLVDYEFTFSNHQLEREMSPCN
ncbi:hypothetical protein [Gillisia hiemivivida]|uniref:Uncharacterized protein n=1 Tax=Gillisia hiemivivida TaxID=291190 RepID=A0A5C6ZSH4_9FLAO|nr:hypothetical protein [Gillisia hiemivivida]TXD91631.1 hypothetical protein ES724_16320 [Gillisia hiemivivida]